MKINRYLLSSTLVAALGSFLFGFDTAVISGTTEALRQVFLELLDKTAPQNVVHTCGSGVTACQNVLAMEIAGLPGSKLYPGSWSEWCADPARPVARG